MQRVSFYQFLEKRNSFLDNSEEKNHLTFFYHPLANFFFSIAITLPSLPIIIYFHSTRSSLHCSLCLQFKLLNINKGFSLRMNFSIVIFYFISIFFALASNHVSLLSPRSSGFSVFIAHVSNIFEKSFAMVQPHMCLVLVQQLSLAISLPLVSKVVIGRSKLFRD